MAGIKGKKEYDAFVRGEALTYKEAVLAQCYHCNGGKLEDCQGHDCPLYQYFPYKEGAAHA